MKMNPTSAWKEIDAYQTYAIVVENCILGSKSNTEVVREQLDVPSIGAKTTPSHRRALQMFWSWRRLSLYWDNLWWYDWWRRGQAFFPNFILRWSHATRILENRAVSHNNVFKMTTPGFSVPQDNIDMLDYIITPTIPDKLTRRM